MDIINVSVEALYRLTNGHPTYLILGLAFFIPLLLVYWYMKNIYPLNKLAKKIDDLVTKKDIEPIVTKLDDVRIRLAVVEDRVDMLWRSKTANSA